MRERRFPNLWRAIKEQQRTIGRVAEQIHMSREMLDGRVAFTLEEMLALQIVLGREYKLEHLFWDERSRRKAATRVDS